MDTAIARRGARGKDAGSEGDARAGTVATPPLTPPPSTPFPSSTIPSCPASSTSARTTADAANAGEAFAASTPARDILGNRTCESASSASSVVFPSHHRSASVNAASSSGTSRASRERIAQSAARGSAENAPGDSSAAATSRDATECAHERNRRANARSAPPSESESSESESESESESPSSPSSPSSESESSRPVAAPSTTTLDSPTNRPLAFRLRVSRAFPFFSFSSFSSFSSSSSVSWSSSSRTRARSTPRSCAMVRRVIASAPSSLASSTARHAALVAGFAPNRRHRLSTSAAGASAGNAPVRAYLTNAAIAATETAASAGRCTRPAADSRMPEANMRRKNAELAARHTRCA